MSCDWPSRSTVSVIGLVSARRRRIQPPGTEFVSIVSPLIAVTMSPSCSPESAKGESAAMDLISRPWSVTCALRPRKSRTPSKPGRLPVDGACWSRSAGRSPRVTLTSWVSSPVTTASVTSSPDWCDWIVLTNCSADSTASPSTLVITSPTFSPAVSAGDPAVTSSTETPPSVSLIWTPSQAPRLLWADVLATPSPPMANARTAIRIRVRLKVNMIEPPSSRTCTLTLLSS